MNRKEFERLVGEVSDDDYKLIELAFMNTKRIETTSQMAEFYRLGGMDHINILLDYHYEVLSLYDKIHSQSRELSECKKKLKELKGFQDIVLDAISKNA